ncbi:uncharacterized protein EI90DRAFT_3027872, partial [Cantharellus anzutake]|uniref:uncharacterized protein n=1 Tax=Cantharellus anzutake TaxID=1750568 RepID=UPI001905CAD8
MRPIILSCILHVYPNCPISIRLIITDFSFVEIWHSDSELLETVLNTSEDSVVTRTIRKLPARFVAPLIQESVSRLNRGIGSVGFKFSKGSGIDAERGGVLIKWLRATLIVHASYLLTDPQLVKRLAKLHTTIASRIAFQDRLLALHGRLDLLLAQIEMRSRNSESALVSAAALTKKVVDEQRERWAQEGEAQRARREVAVSKYVGGESDEEAEEDMDVEMDENEGSIEDVQLGEECRRVR